MEEGMLNAISVVVKEWTWLYIFNVLQLQNLSFICLLQEKEKYYNWLGTEWLFPSLKLLKYTYLVSLCLASSHNFPLIQMMILNW